jgi:predicted RND superfamily exporter protein
MLSIWPPILMTSITTAVGFGSLCLSRLIPIWGFGIFTAVGIICALVFSLTFIPAGLMLFKIPDLGRVSEKGFRVGDIVQAHSEASLGFLGRNVYRRRRIIVTSGLIVAIAALVGFTMVRVDDSFVGMFSRKSEVYISNKLIDEKLSGTVSLNVVIEGREADSIKSPSILKKIASLQEFAEKDAIVGGTISIADYIRRMNKVMNENREEFNTIPDNREAVAQYLLLYSLSGDPDDFDEVVDYDYRQANVIVMLKDDHTAVVKNVATKIREYVSEHFQDEPVDVNLTGNAYVTQVIIDLAVQGMLQSIILSIVVIYIVTAIMFRSLMGGIYTIIPITLAMLINFGLMGTFGISIGFANSVAFAVAMGVGVDYAIHLVFKFRSETAVNSNLANVSAATLQTSGKAISFNAVVVTAGFLVLLASSFTAHRDLGLLLSLGMITSFVGSVTLLPAALCLFKPRFAFPKERESVWWLAKIDSSEKILVETSDYGESDDS